MKYMRFEDSAVLQEFGRLMQEKDELKKTAQLAPASPAEQAWANALKHGPNTTAWKQAKQMLASDKAKMDLLARAEYVYFNESENDSNAWKKVFDPGQQAPAMAKQPAPAAPPVPPARASLSAREKVADQKAYDVTPKEDIVHSAHPKAALVEGELVENLNEQQKADKAIAEKSARLKAVLTALYKLAKRLKAEKNEQAYKLVKETFLDLSTSLKK